jgi:hypothetical protein
MDSHQVRYAAGRKAGCTFTFEPGIRNDQNTIKQYCFAFHDRNCDCRGGFFSVLPASLEAIKQAASLSKSCTHHIGAII